MSRKDVVRSALSGRMGELLAGNSAPSAVPAPKDPAASYVRSGAVGAMGRALSSITQGAEQARALVAAGASVIEIPTDKIEASFVGDRLEVDAEAHQQLLDAIRTAGQRSPILVRPHPNDPDRYQIAFGHRRVRVLAELGRPVRAVVQPLTDEELVVIQGQENAARTDLTYIERALFAKQLEGKGFSRDVIMSALAIEKTQLSRMLSLIHALPEDLVRTIGAAPKTGRPRWAALAERLAGAPSVDLRRLCEREDFRGASSDERFLKVFTALGHSSTSAPQRETLTTPDGAKIAAVERAGGRISVSIDAKAEAFGEFLVANLPQLYARFTQNAQPAEENEG